MRIISRIFRICKPVQLVRNLARIRFYEAVKRPCCGNSSWHVHFIRRQLARIINATCSFCCCSWMNLERAESSLLRVESSLSTFCSRALFSCSNVTTCIKQLKSWYSHVNLNKKYYVLHTMSAHQHSDLCSQCLGSVTFWRIRIRTSDQGSVPLTNGSGSGFGSCSFDNDLQVSTKNKFYFKFFCLLLFEDAFTPFFKDKKS